MSQNTYKVSLLLALTLCCSAAAKSDEGTEKSGPEFSAEVGIGGEYDSNVSVEEVDVTSSQSDYALTMNLGLGVEQKLSEVVEVGLTYDFSQTLYDEFSEVDRQTHILGTDVAIDAGAVDANLSLFYINSLLDGKEFLEMYRLSPSLSGFLSRNWYVRGAYVYSDKAIDRSPERDATTQAGEVDVYYFLRGLRSYFNVGYRYRDEDSVARRLDYTSNGAKLRYILRFDFLSRMNKLELAWRYEDRDYSGITPSIGEPRADKRHRWRVNLEVPVFASGALQFYSGYGDTDSNYPPSDYDRVLIGSRLLYRW